MKIHLGQYSIWHKATCILKLASLLYISVHYMNALLTLGPNILISHEIKLQYVTSFIQTAFYLHQVNIYNNRIFFPIQLLCTYIFISSINVLILDVKTFSAATCPLYVWIIEDKTTAQFLFYIVHFSTNNVHQCFSVNKYLHTFKQQTQAIFI